MLYPFFTSGYLAMSLGSGSASDFFGIVLLTSVPNPLRNQPVVIADAGPKIKMIHEAAMSAPGALIPLSPIMICSTAHTTPQTVHPPHVINVPRPCSLFPMFFIYLYLFLILVNFNMLVEVMLHFVRDGALL